ncbi:hypothetical protein [Halostella litorea]|uniref:hypothetical protein n=1 Tax=Halostella litorea TaxID=2528831 RepID=UPI001091CB36|nr:hypothetical protein [Halostella litorea]
MSRTFELSGSALVRLFEAASLVTLVVFVAPVLWPLNDAASLALAGLFALALAALVAAMWRSRNAGDVARLDTGYDIAYDPGSYPGQAAKERWRKAVERLPGSDGDDEDE